MPVIFFVGAGQNARLIKTLCIIRFLSFGIIILPSYFKQFMENLPQNGRDDVQKTPSKNCSLFIFRLSKTISIGEFFNGIERGVNLK